jgi:transcriptional regulator with XRE-family HTH domain
MSVSQRFKEVRIKLGLTQTEFANGLKIKQASISAIENGGDLSTETERNIAIVYNVNLHWLKTGEGEMFKSTPAPGQGEKKDELSKDELMKENIRLHRLLEEILMKGNADKEVIIDLQRKIDALKDKYERKQG